jgi:hypothetical protein
VYLYLLLKALTHKVFPYIRKTADALSLFEKAVLEGSRGSSFLFIVAYAAQDNQA